MKRLAQLMIFLSAWLGACNSAPTTAVGKIGNTLGEFAQPAIAASQPVMWPLAFTGIVLVVVGALAAWKTADFKLLYIGIGVALVPPAFYFFFTPLLLPSCIFVCILALLMMIRVGWNTYDHVRDGVVQNRGTDNG
jgi:hypothetical protein